MARNQNYEAPASRIIQLGLEVNILSGEITDITVTDPWSGLGGEEDW